MTGVPATSPGSTGSGSNLSPSCGAESGGQTVPQAPSPRQQTNLDNGSTGR